MSNKGKASRKNSEVESGESELENLNDTLVETQTGKEGAITRKGRAKDDNRIEIPSTSRSTRGNKSKITKELSKSSKLMFEMIDSLKVCKLKEQLKELKLSTNGKKKDLQNALKDYVRRAEEHVYEEESDIESSDDESEDENKEDSDTEDSDDEVEEEIARRHVKATRTRRRNVAENDERAKESFTIRDVEESISPFTGDDGLDIRKWIANFEEMAVLLRWTDLQLFIYGKRMLRGSAKKYITHESGVVSWEILKKRLKHEFRREMNGALIHAKLAGRKRLPHESGRQYVYEMQEIASQGQVEDSALIQHVIDGIQDDECNKSILYSAETLDDLKKKLEKYDLMKERSDKRRQAVRKETEKDYKGTRWQTNKKVRCFSCGSLEHNVQNCNNKDRGPKCFKCNGFGHIASNCTESLTSEHKQSKVNCVTTVNNRPVRVKVNGINCEALVDTGSDVNLIQKDIYNEIGRPKLCRASRVFTGLGNIETRPIGKFTAEVTIGEDRYTTEMFVVPTSLMTSKVLLGHELLKETEVLIRKGSISIKRAYPDGEDQPSTTGGTTASREDCEVTELSTVFHVSECEVDVKKPYKEKIEDLIQDYKPNLEVKTDVETKIILNCDNPVCQEPRRLAPKEKKVKYQFLQKRIEFLGHVVENSHVQPSPAKVKAVKQFSEPQSEKHVQSYLGLTGCFKKFICNYSMLDRPLSDVFKGNQKFCFEDAQRQSFIALKTALSREPVLRIYQPTAVTELHMDASKEGYGIILKQKNQDENSILKKRVGDKNLIVLPKCMYAEHIKDRRERNLSSRRSEDHHSRDRELSKTSDKNRLRKGTRDKESRWKKEKEREKEKSRERNKDRDKTKVNLKGKAKEKKRHKYAKSRSRNHYYDVVQIEEVEGPRITSAAADYSKAYRQLEDYASSGAEE